MDEGEERDRGEQEGVVPEEREIAGKRNLHDQQQDGRQPRHEREERHQDDELAEDVLRAGEGLREVDLQRVRPAVVGDQPRADVDGDEEHERLLLLEELPERLGRRRQDRGLWNIAEIGGGGFPRSGDRVLG